MPLFLFLTWGCPWVPASVQHVPPDFRILVCNCFSYSGQHVNGQGNGPTQPSQLIDSTRGGPHTRGTTQACPTRTTSGTSSRYFEPGTAGSWSARTWTCHYHTSRVWNGRLKGHDGVLGPAVLQQVWLLTQSYFVRFIQLRSGVKKCFHTYTQTQSRFASVVFDSVLGRRLSLMWQTWLCPCSFVVSEVMY